MHLIEIAVCSSCVWHWLAAAAKKYLEPMKGHFPNSTDVAVRTKQNTSENWMGDDSLQAPHPLKAGSWTLCPCKPWLQNHKQHSRHVTNGFLIFPHKCFTCKYKAVEITLQKWFDPLSLWIYIFYNPLFMLKNSYLIPFSPFHLVVHHRGKSR